MTDLDIRPLVEPRHRAQPHVRSSASSGSFGPSRSAPSALRTGDHTIAQIVALTDYIAVLGLVTACDLAYHLLVYGTTGSVYGVRFAAVAAVTYLVIIAFRGGYGLTKILRRGRGALDWSAIWIVTLTVDLVILFLLGQGGDLSRGITLSALAAGVVALPPLHAAQGALVRRHVGRYGVGTRRMALIGREADVLRYLSTARPEAQGFLSVAAVYLPDSERDGVRMWTSDAPRLETTSLAAAMADLRGLAPDDAVLVLPWTDAALLETTVEAALQLPVSVYLAPDPAFQTILERRVAPIGRMSAFETEAGLVGLPILRRPFSTLDKLVKRVIDLVGGATALILLAPLLMVVAALIRLESPGPAIYRQTRNGFNETPFTIYKFRSMRRDVSSPGFRQTAVNDARITRVGAFIRRWNIDELPQIINVLLGQMSLVGPRPHATAHNSSVADRIANYACRHHVKPGMTGWAQIHGLRGGTDEAAMRMRVAHDLYYIQNWSPWLDVRIMLGTIFTAKAYRNAR